jgi:hypothetical protein
VKGESESKRRKETSAGVELNGEVGQQVCRVEWGIGKERGEWREERRKERKENIFYEWVSVCVK